MLTNARRIARALTAAVVVVLLGVLGGAWSPSAGAAPTGPSAVIVPAPCTVSHAFPASLSGAQIRDQFGATYGFTMVGSYWTQPEYRGLVQVIWETTDAMACTPFLNDLRANLGGPLALNASALSGWKSGDYGITRARTVSLDFPQLRTYYDKGDHGHVARLFVHEITHAYQSNRDDNPGYWTAFNRQYNALGRLGSYGYSADEVMSEVVGWYVARCALDNPYTTKYQRYYDYAKELFGGKEFGAPLGQPLDCSKQVFPVPPPPPTVEQAPAQPDAAAVATPALAPDAGARVEPFDPILATVALDDTPALLAAQH